MRVETSAARHAREPGNTCWQCCSPPSPRLRRFLATRCATCRNQRHSDCYVDGRRVRFVDVTSYALKRGGAGKGRQGPRRRGSAPPLSVTSFGADITSPLPCSNSLGLSFAIWLACCSSRLALRSRVSIRQVASIAGGPPSLVPKPLQDCEEEDVRRK